MIINYKLTLNEYQEATNFHYKSGKRPLFIAVFLGFATFAMLVGTDFSNTHQVINNLLITFFALSFYLLFTRIMTAYWAKKTYMKSPLLSQKVSLRISNKGIRYNIENEQSTIPWHTFSKWTKNKNYYMIYTNAHQFNIIPTRVLSDDEKEELNGYLKNISN